MTIRFALPIRETNCAAVLSVIRTSGSHYEVLEVWLACIQDIDLPFVKHLIAEYKTRLLLVLRAPQGKRTHILFDLKIRLLTLAGKAGILVDLDLETEREELRFLSLHPDWPRIVSHHDMDKTPDNRTLLRIVRDAEAWQPTIVKIATRCVSASDSLRLLSLLLLLRKKGTRCIILGMGSFGAPNRIFGTLWGNEMIFAPETPAKKSAPGQLTKRQLQDIFTALKGT